MSQENENLEESQTEEVVEEKVETEVTVEIDPLDTALAEAANQH